MLNKLVGKILKDQRGMALSMALILMIAATFIVVPGLWATGSMMKVNQTLENDTMAYYAAQSGISDAIWYFKNGLTPSWIGSPPSYTPYSLPSNPINGMTVKVTRLDVSVIGPYSSTYTIKSEGIDSSGTTRRTLHCELTVNTGSSPFEYGILALNGGITLSNTANVTSIPTGYGSIFANGPIVFNNQAYVDGIASSTSTITGCKAAACNYPVPYPNFVLVDNKTYIQNTNYYYPALIGNQDYTAKTVSLGNETIAGDLTIGNKGIVNLTGPVWVTGNIYFKGGTLNGTDNFTTNYLLASGSISCATSTTINKNPTLISWNGSILFSQAAAGTLGTLYAPNGSINLSQGGSVLGSIVGRDVTLGQSGTDVYLVNSPNTVEGAISGGSGVILTKYSGQ